MKKSEKLKQQGDQEPNDLKAMGLYNKSLREHRSEKFVDKHLSNLEEKGYDIIYDNNGKYTIDTDSQEVKHGVIDYFPKANKLLIRKKNKWVKPGLPWIIKNLL